jgi:hypothetical protein
MFNKKNIKTGHPSSAQPAGNDGSEEYREAVRGPRTDSGHAEMILVPASPLATTIILVEGSVEAWSQSQNSLSHV